jgi:hypothetical protein
MVHIFTAQCRFRQKHTRTGGSFNLNRPIIFCVYDLHCTAPLHTIISPATSELCYYDSYCTVLYSLPVVYCIIYIIFLYSDLPPVSGSVSHVCHLACPLVVSYPCPPSSVLGSLLYVLWVLFTLFRVKSLFFGPVSCILSLSFSWIHACPLVCNCFSGGF